MSTLLQFATTVAPKKAASTKPVVKVDGMSAKLLRWSQVKNELDNLEGEKAMLDSQIKEVGVREWCKLYQAQKCRPESIILTGEAGGSVMVLPMDKYKACSADKAIELAHKYGDDVVEVSTHYSFNTELLNKHMEKIAQAISGLDIPDEDKGQLLYMEQKQSVRKGAIERLNQLGNVADVWVDLEPITMLKGAKI